VAETSYYGPRGPYGTEQEAIAASGVPGWERAEYTTRNLARITGAVEAAGVELGSYDLRILTWLAGWEPQAVEVIAAVIERAAQQPESNGG